jgi:hypothetical protein
LLTDLIERLHPFGGRGWAFLALRTQCSIVHNESLLNEIAFPCFSFYRIDSFFSSPRLLRSPV